MFFSIFVFVSDTQLWRAFGTWSAVINWWHCPDQGTFDW